MFPNKPNNKMPAWMNAYKPKGKVIPGKLNGARTGGGSTPAANTRGRRQQNTNVQNNNTRSQQPKPKIKWTNDTPRRHGRNGQ